MATRLFYEHTTASLACRHDFDRDAYYGEEPSTPSGASVSSGHRRSTTPLRGTAADDRSVVSSKSQKAFDRQRQRAMEERSSSRSRAAPPSRARHRSVSPRRPTTNNNNNNTPRQSTNGDRLRSKSTPRFSTRMDFDELNDTSPPLRVYKSPSKTRNNNSRSSVANSSQPITRSTAATRSRSITPTPTASRNRTSPTKAAKSPRTSTRTSTSTRTRSITPTPNNNNNSNRRSVTPNNRRPTTPNNNNRRSLATAASPKPKPTPTRNKKSVVARTPPPKTSTTTAAATAAAATPPTAPLSNASMTSLDDELNDILGTLDSLTTSTPTATSPTKVSFALANDTDKNDEEDDLLGDILGDDDDKPKDNDPSAAESSGVASLLKGAVPEHDDEEEELVFDMHEEEDVDDEADKGVEGALVFGATAASEAFVANKEEASEEEEGQVAPNEEQKPADTKMDETTTKTEESTTNEQDEKDGKPVVETKVDEVKERGDGQMDSDAGLAITEETKEDKEKQEVKEEEKAKEEETAEENDGKQLDSAGAMDNTEKAAGEKQSEEATPAVSELQREEASPKEDEAAEKEEGNNNAVLGAVVAGGAAAALASTAIGESTDPTSEVAAEAPETPSSAQDRELSTIHEMQPHHETNEAAVVVSDAEAPASPGMDTDENESLVALVSSTSFSDNELNQEGMPPEQPPEGPRDSASKPKKSVAITDSINSAETLTDKSEPLSMASGSEQSSQGARRASSRKGLFAKSKSKKKTATPVLISCKYNPSRGFSEFQIRKHKRVYQGLVDYEKGKVTAKSLAQIMIEELFERDFWPGKHWEIDSARVWEATGSEHPSFNAEKLATWDWKDIYSEASATAVIRFLPDKILIENYAYYVAG